MRHPIQQIKAKVHQLSISISAWHTATRRKRDEGSKHIPVARRQWCWIFCYDLTIQWPLQIVRRITSKSSKPCVLRFPVQAGQWTRSNAFDRSKLTTHTGRIPAAKVLSRKAFAVKRCPSMRLPRRKPCCSSGWWSSSWSSILSRTRHANAL